ncbi:MAG: toll/interleukin-1 receptor domain-containing protein [Candidatus Kryptoniota bacterium]
MANKIAVDVAKLLVVMFESSQENDSWFDGDELKRISGLEPDEINDAVDFLSNEGLIEQMNFIGTFPFKFGQVMLNSRGRYKYYDITSKSNSHAMNPIRHTPPAGSPSIFLSHSSKDKFFVRKLAEQLKNHGVTVWLDEAEINVGDSLTERVGKAIQETDFVGVVLSHNSVNSEWVQKELQAAMQKEIKGRRVVVLPMLLEPVEIPVFLRDKLYADFTSQQKFEESFPKLLRSLGAEADLGVTHSEERAGITMATPDESAPKATVIMTLPPTDRGVQLGLGGLRDFEDIKIVELDDGRTYKPDLDKALTKSI